VKPSFQTLLFLVLAYITQAAPPLALKDGEALGFNVDWTVIPGAGVIDIRAKNLAPTNENSRLSIITKTSTKNLARAFLKFDATSESIYDSKTGRLLSITENSHAREKTRSHSINFSYKNRTASYKDTTTRIIKLPDGYPTDLITCLLSLRNLKMKPGDTHEALVVFDSDFYDLTIHALGYEEIETPLGAFRTLILEPRMEHSPPKGMFKKGTKVRVWISQDSNPLPIRFRVDFKFGAGLANLIRYTPPTNNKSKEKALNY